MFIILYYTWSSRGWMVSTIPKLYQNGLAPNLLLSVSCCTFTEYVKNRKAKATFDSSYFQLVHTYWIRIWAPLASHCFTLSVCQLFSTSFVVNKVKGKTVCLSVVVIHAGLFRLTSQTWHSLMFSDGKCFHPSRIKNVLIWVKDGCFCSFGHLFNYTGFYQWIQL